MLPPESECFVPGEKGDNRALNTKYGQFTKSNRLNTEIHDGLLVGNTVLTTNSVQNSGKIPVRIINSSSEDIVIRKVSTLGYIEEVEDNEICTAQDTVGTSFSDVNCKSSANVLEKVLKWCKPMQDLYQRSCVNLTEKQKHSVFILLEEYKNIFSSGPRDLGL
ncbi:hypothetical protein DPMN_095638 [Dreissena polymorpha]|uniref:Uncharacterized protein n=1 Tax=Dreissena polymorpha TaxID=45954 RepID=A0A9D4L7S9_DREPO|nr:hypothetical protein DPMN_095638 [Dreissena polymorpha]